MSTASTSQQRGFVLSLLRRLRLPQDVATAEHDFLFTRFTPYRRGRKIDDVLTEMTRQQVSTLIDHMKKLADKEDSQ